MRKLLLLSIVILVSVVSCKKKKEANHCYVCQRYELIYAPIFIQYNQPRTLVAIDTLCDRSDSWIQNYMDTHKQLDTIKKGTHMDTIILDQHSSICEIQ